MVYVIPEKNVVDREYAKIIAKIVSEGSTKKDRTGVGTRSIFGHQVMFDVTEQLPIITSKKVHLKSVIHELLWFLSGDTNIKYLKDNKVRIWDEWADENGDLGPVYGKQWRSWAAPNGETIDQIKKLIDDIRNTPNSRRLIVNAWNVGDLEDMALPPCHMFFQCYVRNDEFIDLHLYQRSVDVALGLPFNWACYSLLIHLIAQQTNYKPGRLIHSMGDVHIYSNHEDLLKSQIHQKTFDQPTITINKAKDIFSYQYDDFEVQNYQHSPSIKMDVAV